MLNNIVKQKCFSENRIDITGSPAFTGTWIYQPENSKVMVRETCIKSGKGGEPVRILQFTDTHLNKINQHDTDENNPVIASTRQYRMAFRNESTVPNLVNALELVPFFDETVITGDVMDYLTWGSLELVDELILSKYPRVIMPPGMHDFLRKMEGDVEDTTSLESRMEIVRQVWPHDLFYHSKIVRDKVMLIALYNNITYYDFQQKKLEEDIKLAREKKLPVLIFQHEPLCTGKAEDSYVEPLRHNSRQSSKNFFDAALGGENRTNAATRDMYNTIVSNADVIKGIFCGHRHNDYYTEIKASYKKGGNTVETVIPQYVLTGNMYDEGHVMIITVE